MMCRCVQNSSAEIRLPVAHDDMNQQEGNHSTLSDVVTPWRDLCHPLRSIAQESRPGASCLHASWQSMPPGPRRGWHFYDLAWWPLNVRTRGLLVWSPDMNSSCSTSPVCLENPMARSDVLLRWHGVVCLARAGAFSARLQSEARGCWASLGDRGCWLDACCGSAKGCAQLNQHWMCCSLTRIWVLCTTRWFV